MTEAELEQHALRVAEGNRQLELQRHQWEEGRLLNEEKFLSERMWALLADTQLQEVYKQFGYEPFRRSSVLEGFEKFIKANGFAGDTCVEIGTWAGLTAVVLARYFKHVVSIDILDNEYKQKILNVLHVENVEFVNARDNVHKAEVIRALKFDGAYVDGDHANDTSSDFQLVKRAKRVLFHEFWEAQPAVMRAVDRLASEKIVTDGKFALWTNT